MIQNTREKKMLFFEGRKKNKKKKKKRQTKYLVRFSERETKNFFQNRGFILSFIFFSYH